LQRPFCLLAERYNARAESSLVAGLVEYAVIHRFPGDVYPFTPHS